MLTEASVLGDGTVFKACGMRLAACGSWHNAQCTTPYALRLMTNALRLSRISYGTYIHTYAQHHMGEAPHARSATCIFPYAYCLMPFAYLVFLTELIFTHTRSVISFRYALQSYSRYGFQFKSLFTHLHILSYFISRISLRLSRNSDF